MCRYKPPPPASINPAVQIQKSRPQASKLANKSMLLIEINLAFDELSHNNSGIGGSLFDGNRELSKAM
jgi:hypothetical protein